MYKHTKAPVIVIADDHPLFQDALMNAIQSALPDCSIPITSDLIETRNLLRKLDEIDLLLLDLSMPGSDGLLGLISLRAEFRETPIIVVSATDDEVTINRCIQLGASGFIPKSSSPEYIKICIKTVLEGGNCIPPTAEFGFTDDDDASELIRKIQSLTPRQALTLCMIAEGMLNREIADDLGIREATVKAHVSVVLSTFGVTSRTRVVIAIAELIRSLSGFEPINFMPNENEAAAGISM